MDGLFLGIASGEDEDFLSQERSNFSSHGECHVIAMVTNLQESYSTTGYRMKAN